MTDIEKFYMLLTLTQLKYLKYVRFVIFLHILSFHTGVQQFVIKRQKHSTLFYKSIHLRRNYYKWTQ